LGVVLGKEKKSGIVYDIKNKIPLGHTKTTTIQIISIKEVTNFIEKIKITMDLRRINMENV
jgi:hypothetical protein